MARGRRPGISIDYWSLTQSHLAQARGGQGSHSSPRWQLPNIDTLQPHEIALNRPGDSVRLDSQTELRILNHYGVACVRNKVFIHTNDKQLIGALVSAHSMKRNSRTPDSFEVELIRTEDYPWYAEMHGKTYLREKGQVVWDAHDLQSFTTTRFMPPQLMNYQGRAIVVDPDVFAVGDVDELFRRNMRGKAVMARYRLGYKGYANYIATSVMLLDNAKLPHWDVERDFRAMFKNQRDYEIWLRLGYEDQKTIGRLEDCWNDFDNLDSTTRMIHNTKRRTQPWKTGLPVDFTNRKGLFGILPANWTPQSWIKRQRLSGSYWRHPDQKQEQYFFALLKECIDNGSISKPVLQEHMALKHVRLDALDIINQVPSVNEILGPLVQKAAE